MASGGDDADSTFDLRRLVTDHLDEVRRYGFTLIGVAAQGLEPGWFYSCGLHRSSGQPELITIGLPPRSAYHLLWAMGTRVMAGEQLTPGRYGGKPLPIQPISVATVGDLWCSASDYFNLGRIIIDEGWRAQRWPPTTQVIWANRDGRFPDETPIHSPERVIQPQLVDSAERIV